jgi:hypothetical protein
MAKASEQMEKALKVSECVPEIGTELHRERLLSKLLNEAVVDGDPQTILLFKGLVRAAGENWKMGSMLADQICHNVTPAPGLGGSKPKAVSIDTQPQDPAVASGDGQIFGAYGLSARCQAAGSINPSYCPCSIATAGCGGWCCCAGREQRRRSGW